VLNGFETMDAEVEFFRGVLKSKSTKEGVVRRHMRVLLNP
jgi:hypothetical protein